MRHTPDTSAPTCPGCGARHYPATTGAGFRVWCDGSSADTNAERMLIYRARAEQLAEQERAHAERDSFRIEHARRAGEQAPLESWEIPDSMPDSMPDRI